MTPGGVLRISEITSGLPTPSGGSFREGVATPPSVIAAFQRSITGETAIVTLELKLRFKVYVQVRKEPSGVKIGELAHLAGVPAATIRYYERRGILPEPPRTGSGYRRYGPGTVERLRFIKRAQELGFTLEEIEEFLALRVDDPASCARVEAKTREKIAGVVRRISELKRLEGALRRLVDACAARAATAECPVLEMLVHDEDGGA